MNDVQHPARMVPRPTLIKDQHLCLPQARRLEMPHLPELLTVSGGRSPLAKEGFPSGLCQGVFRPGIVRGYRKLFFPPGALVKSQTPQLPIPSSTSIRARKALQSPEKLRPSTGAGTTLLITTLTLPLTAFLDQV